MGNRKAIAAAVEEAIDRYRLAAVDAGEAWTPEEHITEFGQKLADVFRERGDAF